MGKIVSEGAFPVKIYILFYCSVKYDAEIFLILWPFQNIRTLPDGL